MGSQEQPWALEQHGADSAVQSKGFYFLIFAHIQLQFWWIKKYVFCQSHDLLVHFKLETYNMFVEVILPPVILRQSPQLLPHTVCVLLCFQLFSVNMDYSKLKKDRPDF